VAVYPKMSVASVSYAHISSLTQKCLYVSLTYIKCAENAVQTSPLRVDELLDKTLFSYLLQFQNDSCCRVDVFSGTPVYWDWYVLTKIKLIVTICNITLQHAR